MARVIQHPAEANVPVNLDPTATIGGADFSSPGATTFAEDYRITERGEARLTEDGEVIQLEV